MIENRNIDQMTEHELLKFIVSNQVQIFQHLDRIFKHLYKQNPDSQELIGWLHKNEIYEKFIKNAEDTHRQISRHKNE